MALDAVAADDELFSQAVRWKEVLHSERYLEIERQIVKSAAIRIRYVSKGVRQEYRKEHFAPIDSF